MKIKKILSAIIACAMIMSTMAFTAFADETENWIASADTSWYNTTDTSFTIDTAEKLAGLAKLVEEGNTFAGKIITLGADINLAGKEWDAGTYGKPFSGELNGAGKTISNLTDSSAADHKGLFAHMNNAYVYDLKFKDVKFTGTYAGGSGLYAGALVGEAESKNIVINVDVEGITWTVASNKGSIGSIAGYSYDTNYINCDVTAAEFNVTSTSNVNIGGLVGQGRGVGTFSTEYNNTSTYSYKNCTVTNPVFNVTGKTTVGGFLGCDGYNHWANYGIDCTVDNLVVTCSNDDAQYTVGGFMGSNDGANYGKDYAFENCTVNGTVIAKGSNTASTFGGFVGYVGGRPLSIGNCSADVDITATAGDVAGFVGETQQYFAHEYAFDGCTASGDVSTVNGTAGGFIANIQHGGDGSALNVTITDATVEGIATGTVAGSGAVIGNIDDAKKDTATGGDIVIENITAPEGTATIGTKTESVKLVAAKIGDEKYETLDAAIAAAVDGDMIEVMDGTYTWDANWKVQNKAVTFEGGRNAVIDMTNVHTGQNTSDATLIFNGVTFEFSDTANYKGFSHTTKVVYNDCAINGKQHLYAPTVEFKGCVLTNYNDYCVWTYGAKDVTFENCIFNTGGKAVLVYNEDTSGTFVADIKLATCTFNDNDNLDTKKAAVELGNNPMGTNTYNLDFTECTVNGFAINDEGISTGSTLWGNKHGMSTDDVEIVIDNEVVYGQKDTTVSTVTFGNEGASVSFEDYIFINQYFTATGIDEADMIAKGGVLSWTGTETDPAKMINSDSATISTIKSGTSGFSGRTMGIFPDKYMDTIYVCPFVDLGEGNYAFGDVQTYTLEALCKAALIYNISDTEKAVYNTLLAYCEAVEAYVTSKNK